MKTKTIWFSVLLCRPPAHWVGRPVVGAGAQCRTSLPRPPSPRPLASRRAAAPQLVTLFNANVSTADGGGSACHRRRKVDLQWLIDQTAVNTVTLKLQFSNDSTNWIDGATFVTNNAADAGDMQQYAVFGRYLRLCRRYQQQPGHRDRYRARQVTEPWQPYQARSSPSSAG